MTINNGCIQRLFGFLVLGALCAAPASANESFQSMLDELTGSAGPVLLIMAGMLFTHAVFSTVSGLINDPDEVHALHSLVTIGSRLVIAVTLILIAEGLTPDDGLDTPHTPAVVAVAAPDSHDNATSALISERTTEKDEPAATTAMQGPSGWSIAGAMVLILLLTVWGTLSVLYAHRRDEVFYR